MLWKVKLRFFWGFVFHSDDWKGPVWEPLSDGTLNPRDCEGYTTTAGEKLGATAPSLRWEDRNPTDPTDVVTLAFRDWWKAARGLMEQSGCRFVFLGEEDNLLVAVAVASSYHGGTAPVHSCGPSLVVDEIWEGKLRTFCETVGIHWTQPQWTMAAVV